MAALEQPASQPYRASNSQRQPALLVYTFFIYLSARLYYGPGTASLFPHHPIKKSRIQRKQEKATP